MSSILIYGNVTKVFPAEGKAVVFFDDRNIASKKLPIVTPRTFSDKESDPMEEGEHVACLMDCNLEDGVILGAIYSTKETPPEEAGANVWVKEFKDGTVFKYNRTTHVYSIVNGTTEFKLSRTGGFSIKKGAEDLGLLMTDTLDQISLITVASFGTPPVNIAAFTAIRLRVVAFFSA